MKEVEMDKNTKLSKLEAMLSSYDIKMEAEIETLKDMHDRETTKNKDEAEAMLKDIKYLYEQKIIKLEERLQQASNECEVLQPSRMSLSGATMSKLEELHQKVAEMRDEQSNLLKFKIEKEALI